MKFLLETTSRAEKFDDKLRQLETSEMHSEKDPIDRYAEYVPSIDQSLHKEVAQKLISKVESATRDLAQEIELAKEKTAFLQTLEVQIRRADVEKKAGDFKFDDFTATVEPLIKVFESKDPYSDLRAEISTGKLSVSERDRQRLSAFQDEFGAAKKFVAKFWKKSEHEKNIGLAQRAAKEITQQKLVSRIAGVTEKINLAKRELFASEHNRVDLRREYCSAGSENIEAAAEALVKATDFYALTRGHEAVLDELGPLMESFRDRDGGESGFYFGQASGAISSYREVLHATESRFSDAKKIRVRH